MVLIMKAMPRGMIKMCKKTEMHANESPQVHLQTG